MFFQWYFIIDLNFALNDEDYALDGVELRTHLVEKLTSLFRNL